MGSLRIFLVSILAGCALAGCKARQHHSAVRLMDAKTETEILVGTASLDSLYNAPFSEWYLPNLGEYEPDAERLPDLDTELEDIDITVVLGTWCKDSKREVPRFVKILTAAGYPTESVRVIGVTRDKETPLGEEKGLGLIQVPTLIFYRNGTELGRIVEFPVESLEADMLKILRGEPYRHAYDWD